MPDSPPNCASASSRRSLGHRVLGRTTRFARYGAALAALASAVVGATPAHALTLPQATALTLPSPNFGLDQGYLPFQSCASAGNCAITGMYLNAQSVDAGVIEYSLKGLWQTPVTVAAPAGAVLSRGVTMDAIACPAVKACLALGQYVTTAKVHSTTVASYLPFVTTQVGGTWKAGVALSLPANALANGENATPHSLTCTSVGNCVVVGTYTTDTNIFATEGFVANEVKGVWHQALEVTLPVGANANPFVSLQQVACWSNGNCAAAGSYIDANNVARALIVPEVSGAWHRGLAIGLPANASAFAGSQFNEVTCLAGGACLAIGSYDTVTGAVQPLAALASGGVWNRALEVRLPHAAANPQTLTFGFGGVACASAGNCAFGGQFLDASGRYQGFLDNVVNGFVQPAKVLTLPAGALQTGHNGGVVSLSCPSAGNCVAGAAYLNSANRYQGLVVSETAGVWATGQTIALPNAAATVGVGGGVYSVQCFTAALCQVSGSYLATATRYQGFTIVTSA